MPEGPQMVILKEQAEHFIGQEVIKAAGKAKAIPFEALKGKVLIDIKTFGKEILFCFEGFTIGIHLLLFGKYSIDRELNRELHLGLQFDDGNINFYACKCIYIQEPLDKLYDWSIDVLNPSFDKHRASESLCRIPNALVCEALLNQDILAGVGNKIKNEVLFRRRVHPESLVGQIPKEELHKLVDECVKLSYEYLDWKREGSGNEHWEVYQRKECLRDNFPLRKEKIGKSRRSCYFCDKCQRLYLPE